MANSPAAAKKIAKLEKTLKSYINAAGRSYAVSNKPGYGGDYADMVSQTYDQNGSEKLDNAIETIAKIQKLGGNTDALWDQYLNAQIKNGV